MDNIIVFGLDVSSNNRKQINTINNTIFAYNMIGGCFNTDISGGNYDNSGNPILFSVPVAGLYVINVYATAYSSSNANLQINILINGENTNMSLKKYTNELNSHKLLVPLSFKYRLNQGTNTITLRLAGGTLANNVDYASFSWFYSPS
jgi:hypothetical protein